MHSIVDGMMTHDRIYRCSIFTNIYIGFIKACVFVAFLENTNFTLAFLEMVSFCLIDARTSASVKEQYKFQHCKQEYYENKITF